MQNFTSFFTHCTYQVFTDHLPLKYLRSQSKPTPRLVRWLSEIELYDPEILYKPGVENQVPDLLSRRDGPESRPAEKSIQPRYLYHITAALKSLPLLDQDPIQDWPLHYLSSQDTVGQKIAARNCKIPVLQLAVYGYCTKLSQTLIVCTSLERAFIRRLSDMDNGYWRNLI
ncbi:hypothetical protein G6F36_011841 [Rhizopus arrhizus]|nr:hypothetical protein G6F36_011841 [Rhizopus arrhizus]